MSKTWLSVMTAVGLVGASVGIFVARRSALGPEAEGPLGWQVRLVVEGTLLTKDASIAVARPLDFRRQHVTDEHFQSSKSLHEPTQWKRLAQRRITWRRPTSGADTLPLRVEYTSVCSR